MRLTRPHGSRVEAQKLQTRILNPLGRCLHVLFCLIVDTEFRATNSETLGRNKYIYAGGFVTGSNKPGRNF